jgi:hypothetical protein
LTWTPVAVDRKLAPANGDEEEGGERRLLNREAAGPGVLFAFAVEGVDEVGLVVLDVLEPPPTDEVFATGVLDLQIS